MKRNPRVASVALLAVTLWAGCSGAGPKGIVTGEVTLDRKPLAEGLIRFVPIGGMSQTADATIAGGRFSAPVPVGEVRVEITSPKVVGKMKMYDTPDSPVVDKIEEAVPPQYNVNSELTMTVVKGTTERKFELDSK